jgi:cytochrome P450
MFELYSHPTILATAKSELTSAISDPTAIPTFAQLDGLAFFNAVITETIRLHPGVVNRQRRYSPEPIVYRDVQRGTEYVIPAGVTYGMTLTILHRTAEVFTDPGAFSPQRWVENAKLSRGPRGCIG